MILPKAPALGGGGAVYIGFEMFTDALRALLVHYDETKFALFFGTRLEALEQCVISYGVNVQPTSVLNKLFFSS